MSSLAEKAVNPVSATGLGQVFHLRIACVCLAMFLVVIAGDRATEIRAGAGAYIVATLVVFLVFVPLLLYLRERGWRLFQESVLILLWEIIFASTAPLLVLIASRTRMPLQDALFGRADQMLGISVPAIAAWAGQHSIGRAITASYPLITPFLVVAALLPLAMGRVLPARRFLLSNVIALAIGFTLFALLPAVGPWYYFHTAPVHDQVNCQAMLLGLRRPGPYSPSPVIAGIVCFPSFHVIWAILCAAGLWFIRPLRIPLLLLSTAIAISTLTTGWHYFSDVLAGILIAVASIEVARQFSNS